MYLEQSGEIGRKLEQILGGSENFEVVGKEIFLRGLRAKVYYWDGYWPEETLRAFFYRLRIRGRERLRRAAVCADASTAIRRLWCGGFLVTVEGSEEIFLLWPEDRATSSFFS